MKTEAGREVDTSGTASATTRIAFFIFLRVASGCGFDWEKGEKRVVAAALTVQR